MPLLEIKKIKKADKKKKKVVKRRVLFITNIDYDVKLIGNGCGFLYQNI